MSQQKYPTSKPRSGWYIHWWLDVWAEVPYHYDYLWRNEIGESIGCMGMDHYYWGA